MPGMKRRQALKATACLWIGTAIAGGGNSADAVEPHLTFPAQPRDRIAIASWPFRKFIDAPGNRWARDPKLPGMDLTAFPAMVVRRFGIHHLEPLDEHFASTDPQYIALLRESVEKAECRVVDIPCDVKASFYDPDVAQRKLALANGRKWVEIAAQLGSPSIRTSISGPAGLTPDVERTAATLAELADYGATTNIIIALENDDNFTEDPFFIVKVLEKVRNPYLRALPDFCHSMLTHDQDFNNRAMEAMFTHAYNIAHVKDSEADDAGRYHTVDVAKCFEIAKAEGYRGYFSMEWEGHGEPFGGTQRLIQETLAHLGSDRGPGSEWRASPDRIGPAI